MSDTIAHEPLEGLDDTANTSGGSRRMLMLVAGGAAVLVLALAVYFLFLSGGEEEVAGPAAPAPAPTAPDKGGKGDKDKAGSDVPKEVDKDFAVGRDPFQPLAVEAIVEDPAVTDDTATGTGNTGTDPVTDPGTPAPAPTVAPQPVPTVEPTTTYQVKLISVDLVKEKATIAVDGKRYVVAVQVMFPNTKTGPFQLTSVGERPSGKDTATVVFGADAPVELVQQDKVTFEN
jgi:hypothetical protein